MARKENETYPDAEMQAALHSLEFDPLPQAAPVEPAYPGRTINRTTLTDAWRYSA